MTKRRKLKLSRVLGVDSRALQEKGVFNSLIGEDSELYLDPRLLKTTSVTELSQSHEVFRSHFEKIIKLLIHSSEHGDNFFKKAIKGLTFKEPDFLSLGYSIPGNSGRGIGKKFAQSLARTAKEILQHGITDPEIFEIVGIFEEGIGADRISDMTARIILPNLALYSERIAHELGLTAKEISFSDNSYKLPVNIQNKAPLLLLPQEILNDLPIANDRGDLDEVFSHNEKLREDINHIIGEVWKDSSTKYLRKREIKEALLQNPEALRELIRIYKERNVNPYNFEKDPRGLINWLDIAEEYTAKYPLEIPLDSGLTAENILEVVLVICKRFKALVEDNGLSECFWDEKNEKCKNERFAQRLFFAVADSYCEANNLDLNRESNAGRGPVDFKLSQGAKAKVNVEVKYTSNDVKHAYETQLPIYNKAERTEHCILLIIINTKITKALEELRIKQAKDIQGNKKVPEIFIVDGRIRPSASHAK